MKANELAAQLTQIQVEVDKAKLEITNKIAALEASLANVDLPAEATAALDALKTSVQSVDDIVPDAPPTP